jgi:glycine/D-amino acid oxidase-like deaminating enzyme
VLVIGAGITGAMIAEALAAAGREWLSTSAAGASWACAPTSIPIKPVVAKPANTTTDGKRFPMRSSTALFSTRDGRFGQPRIAMIHVPAMRLTPHDAPHQSDEVH